MRKVTLFMSALMVGSIFTTVKAQFDVGATAIPNMVTNTTVYPNIPNVIQYTRQNFGSAVASADVDSFTMEIVVNSVRRQTFYRNMATNFGVSATETTQGVTALNWGSLGIPAGSTSLCVRTRLWKNGVNIDQNTGNDEFCTTVIYAGDGNPFKYDLSMLNPHINDPLILPGNNVTPSTFLVKVGFDLKNTGTVDIPAGIAFSANITMKSVPHGPFSGTTAAFSQGGSVLYTIDAITNGITLPTTNGPFELCASLVANNDDTDHSNDDACSSYTLGPNGIQKIEEDENLEVFFNSNVLNVNMLEDASGVYSLQVISINGQSMLAQDLNSDNSKSYALPMNNLTAGMYIANVSKGSKMVESMRFVVE